MLVSSKYQARFESTQILYQIWMESDKFGKKINVLKQYNKNITNAERKNIIRLVEGVFYSYKIIDRIVEQYLVKPIDSIPIPLKIILYLGSYELICFKKADPLDVFKDYKKILNILFAKEKSNFLYAIFVKLYKQNL